MLNWSYDYFGDGITWPVKEGCNQYTLTVSSTGGPKILSLVCVDAVKELYIRLSRLLHSCIGQASAWSLRPCLSQSDTWLLIYGRKKAK